MNPADMERFRELRQWCENTMEPTIKRLERYEEYFRLSPEALQELYHEFQVELEEGVRANRRHPREWHPEECSFRMLDSCISTLPTGEESGVYYALDFGGTNFRAVRLILHGNNRIEIDQEKRVLNPDQSTQCGGLLEGSVTATEMFDAFAETVKELMLRHGDDPLLFRGAGFTFSFPIQQGRLDSAYLGEWTKGYETGRDTDDPVEGRDVAALMNQAFKRQRMNVRVVSVLNDTVGALLSAAYELPRTIDSERACPCLAAVILGTGLNAAYVEPQARDSNYVGTVINTECGNFDLRRLPLNNVDRALDFDTTSRGRQALEKMISGAYLGELCRGAVVKVLQARAPADSWRYYSLSSERASLMMGDKSSECVVVRQVLQRLWGEDSVDNETLLVVRRICRAVIRRSAALAAVVIAAVARRTGYLQPAMGGVTVAVDGSLYKNVPEYPGFVRESLKEILGPAERLLHVIVADDGSGKGAGVLAAALAVGGVGQGGVA